MAGLLTWCRPSVFAPSCIAAGRGIRRSTFPLSHAFHSIRNPAVRFGRTLHVQNSIFLALQIVIVHKKFFQLFDELLTEFFDVVDMGITVVRLLDGDDPIVALTFFLLSLLTLDDSDDAAFKQTAGKGGLIHQHEHVGRVAVFGFGRWDEAEVVREGHPGRQDLRQSEDSQLFIECVFVSAALGRFDDDLDFSITVCRRDLLGPPAIPVGFSCSPSQSCPFLLIVAPRTSRTQSSSSSRDIQFKMRLRAMPVRSAEAAANTINRSWLGP